MKTTIDSIANPKTILIVIGVLSGYIRNWPFFIFRLLFTFGKFKKSISLELPKDFIESTAFMAHLYLCLQDKMDKNKAFEITRAVVLTSGMAIQQANFRNVEDERTYSNLITYQKRTNKEGITKLNTIDIIEESEKRYEFIVTRCLFYEFFNALDMKELTSIMCSVDNAIFGSYMGDDLTFYRRGKENTIYKGNSECRFVIENNS